MFTNRCQYAIMLAHTPWDAHERIKGSVLAWNNHATRIKAEAQPRSLSSRLCVVHHKRARSGLCLEFGWQELAAGGEMSGLVPHSVTADNAPTPKKGPTGAKQKLALDCLHQTLAERVDAHPGHPDIPSHARLARYERVEAAFVRVTPGAEDDWRKREAFKRSIAAMQARHLVKHLDGFLWA